MASITSEPNGCKTIQFVGNDRKRRSLRLGKVPIKHATVVKVHVEHLLAAKLTGSPLSTQTSSWLSDASGEMRKKLANAGLIAKQTVMGTVTLAAYLSDYINERTDVKPRTKINLQHSAKSLIAFFGAGKLLHDISPGDTDEFRRFLTISQGFADNTARRILGRAKQFFRFAHRKRLISENPFADMKGCGVRANPDRYYFLSKEDSKKS